MELAISNSQQVIMGCMSRLTVMLLVVDKSNSTERALLVSVLQAMRIFLFKILCIFFIPCF